MAADPIAVADALLDAALAAHADVMQIEPDDAHYAVTIRRQGELIADVPMLRAVAAPVIARLGYVCNVDTGARGAQTGRARVRSYDTQRDVILTIEPRDQPCAKLLFVAPADRRIHEPEIGDRIGHFRVVSVLGAGGMGSVYEVVHERLGRRHALKVLRPAVLERDRACLERFVQEAQAAARVRSAHIVEIFDLGYLDDGRPYFVMELLAGESLAELVARGSLAGDGVLSIARQLAEALIAAHDRGIVHADVTAGNVMVSDGHVTVIDFGLAHLVDREHDAPADQVSGTPSYLAPERVRGFAADEASDQYAFGIVLYEMLAGRPPFVGTTDEICIAHLTAMPPPLRNTPAPLANVVARCLAKTAADRFPSMRDVRDALVAIEEALS